MQEKFNSLLILNFEFKDKQTASKEAGAIISADHGPR